MPKYKTIHILLNNVQLDCVCVVRGVCMYVCVCVGGGGCGLWWLWGDANEQMNLIVSLLC